jgi:hypothetical protein
MLPVSNSMPYDSEAVAMQFHAPLTPLRDLGKHMLNGSLLHSYGMFRGAHMHRGAVQVHKCMLPCKASANATAAGVVCRCILLRRTS